MASYANICTACEHGLSEHLMVQGGELKAGPYRCRRGTCACEVAQDSPSFGVSQRQWEELYSTRAESRAMLRAAWKNDEQRAHLQASAAAVATREPVADDFKWLDDERVSLQPLMPEQALRGLLATPPIREGS